MSPKPLSDYWLAAISELRAPAPESFGKREPIELTIQFNEDLRPTTIEIEFAVRSADANSVGVSITPSAYFHYSVRVAA